MMLSKPFLGGLPLSKTRVRFMPAQTESWPPLTACCSNALHETLIRELTC